MSSLMGSQGIRGPAGSAIGKKMAGYDIAQMQQYTPEQMQLFQNLFSQVSPNSYLSRLAGGDESLLNQIEQPALRQFSGLQGNIASRFSGMGSGARRSSGFQNTMNQASSDFAQQLQAQRLGLQRQAMQDLMGMSEALLQQRPYEQFLVQPAQRQQLWQQLLGGGLPIAGAALGGYFGGLPGAQLGGKLGAFTGQSFLD